MNEYEVVVVVRFPEGDTEPWLEVVRADDEEEALALGLEVMEEDFKRMNAEMISASVDII